MAWSRTAVRLDSCCSIDLIIGRPGYFESQHLDGLLWSLERYCYGCMLGNVDHQKPPLSCILGCREAVLRRSVAGWPLMMHSQSHVIVSAGAAGATYFFRFTSHVRRTMVRSTT